MWYAIELVVVFILMCISWRSGYKECLSDQKKNRERIKLESTKENIVNRLAKTIKEGFYNNKQWGFRFMFESDTEEDVTYICVRDKEIDSLPIILHMNIYTSYNIVMVRSKMENKPIRTVGTKNPSDTELTLLIGQILDDLQVWSPEKQTV
jgi:hypothetical protein